MAGYSRTPLEQKLGLKPGHVTFLDHPPESFALEAPTTRRMPSRADVTLTFHTTEAGLARRLPTLIEHTGQAGMIWICWPKKSARQQLPSELDEHGVRRLGLATGLVDVKVAAIDEVWSGLKFVRRLADRI